MKHKIDCTKDFCTPPHCTCTPIEEPTEEQKTFEHKVTGANRALLAPSEAIIYPLEGTECKDTCVPPKDETVKQCHLAWERGNELGRVQGFAIAFIPMIITIILIKLL